MPIRVDMVWEAHRARRGKKDQWREGDRGRKKCALCAKCLQHAAKQRARHILGKFPLGDLPVKAREQPPENILIRNATPARAPSFFGTVARPIHAKQVPHASARPAVPRVTLLSGFRQALSSWMPLYERLKKKKKTAVTEIEQSRSKPN